MDKKLFGTAEDEKLYQALLTKAGDTSEIILEKTHKLSIQPISAASYIVNEARRLIETRPNTSHSSGTFSQFNKTPAVVLLDIISDNIENIVANTVSGEDLVQNIPGLWYNLMHQSPMVTYAKMASQFLIYQGLLSGRVLELGAGVGNTSNLIKEKVNQQYIRSDIHLNLMTGCKIPGERSYYDFNQPGKWLDLDTIFSVNALHCAKDKQKTVKHLFDMLKDGGTLLLAEGNNTTYNHTPWALNCLFGIFDGWWNISGFLERKDWQEIFTQSGFKEQGYIKLTSGEHDLGGLLWAKKKKQ